MRTNPSRLCGLILGSLPLLAGAHPGHGEPFATHWHASDAWGWSLGLAVAALALWLMRRK